MSAFVKDPSAKKDYEVDWAQRLASAETIADVVWTVPAGITQHEGLNTETATTATIWLSGGTAGERYEVTSHITTNQGREDEWSFTVMVEDQ